MDYANATFARFETKEPSFNRFGTFSVMCYDEMIVSASTEVSRMIVPFVLLVVGDNRDDKKILIEKKVFYDSFEGD